MNAICLAGGFGTRLKPLTNSTPKPMLRVANRPIIDYCVAQLHHFGIDDIVFTLGYKSEMIAEWVLGYADITAHFSVENVPLGTLGAVKAAAKFLSDTFIVLSGDGISDINLNALLNRHLANKALVTAVVTKTDTPQLYGVARLNGNGLIDDFVEKPHEIEGLCHINCGAYAVDKSVLGLIENDECDFARDLFPVLVRMGKLGYYEHNGYWRDVGDIRSFYATNFDMAREGAMSQFSPLKNDIGQRDFSKLVGRMDRSLISESAKIEGFVSESIVGANVEIERFGSVDRCVVLEGAKVTGRHFGCVLGRDFCVDVFDTAKFDTIRHDYGAFSAQITNS